VFRSPLSSVLSGSGGTMDTRELLGKRIRELRKKRGLTQEKLAEEAGIDVKYLGGIERGTENPTVGILEKLATALSVKLHQLLNFEHELPGRRALRRRIQQTLEKCDEKELQMILRLVGLIKE
jgi:transcriptional regulator with XRE-family HTH domain